MRKLMWLSVGFTAAIATASYTSILLGVLLPLSLLFLLMAILLRKSSKSWVQKTAIMLVGLSLGFGWFLGFDAFLLSGIRKYDGTTQEITVEVSDYSFENQYGSAADGKISIKGRNYNIRLYCGEWIELNPGDRITCRAKLRYTPFGGSSESTYHKGNGIFLIGYASGDILVTKCQKAPEKYLPVIYRRLISQRITEIFPEDASPFAKALLLGDDTDLSFGEDVAFQKSGIRHVIAVSGLHISILLSVLYFFTARKRYLTCVIGIPVLFFFAALAGYSPSVVRACLMQGLLILSIAVNREYDPPTALSFSVMAMLLMNPLTITSVSFQLSVGSMIGIFAFAQPIMEYLRRKMGEMRGRNLKSKLKRWFVGSVSISIAAMTVTLPLCTIYFGMVSVISVVTNLVTLWVITFIFCGIMLSCLLSLIWMPLGMAAAWIVSIPIYYVLGCANLLSRIPYAVAYTDSPYTILWIILSVLLIGWFLFSKRRSVLLLTVSMVILYSLCQFFTWMEPRSDNVRLKVLDVGQGQCILLQCRDDSYLIDCGSTSGQRAAEKAMLALGAQGIRELDGLILTHYNADHANGIEFLLDVFPVKTLYLPERERDNDICNRLILTKAAIEYITVEKILPCGDGEFRLLPSIYEERNGENSICVLFQSKNCDILITGDCSTDGERELIRRYGIPELDILIVGHHGSDTSTGLELLNHTRPDVAIISVGENNTHGHPDSDTLKRLARFGCRILRTDRDGDIVIRR